MTARNDLKVPTAAEERSELPIRVGITTPVVTLVPGGHASWEVDGGIEDVAAIARTAEDLGYYHLTCSEHVVIPDRVAAARCPVCPIFQRRYDGIIVRAAT